MAGFGGGWGGWGGSVGYYGPAAPLTGVNSTHTTIVQQPQPLFLGYGASLYEEYEDSEYKEQEVIEEHPVSYSRKPAARRKSTNNATATNVNNIYIDNSRGGAEQVSRTKPKIKKHPDGVCSKPTCARTACQAAEDDDEDDREYEEEDEDDSTDRRRCTKHRQCKSNTECSESGVANWRRGVQRNRN